MKHPMEGKTYLSKLDGCGRRHMLMVIHGKPYPVVPKRHPIGGRLIYDYDPRYKRHLARHYAAQKEKGGSKKASKKSSRKLAHKKVHFKNSVDKSIIDREMARAFGEA